MSSSSLHHLLNFRYERERSAQAPCRRRHTSKSRPKESFMQTNFRFILSPHAPPAHPAMFEGDSHIDWEFVDIVSLPSTRGGLGHCPICLDDYRAPKISRCGHIFCAPCILRHLSSYSRRRCPMCYDNLCRSDLRTVEPSTAQDVQEGQEIIVALLARWKGSIAPMLVYEEDDPRWNMGREGCDEVHEASEDGRVEKSTMCPEAVGSKRHVLLQDFGKDHEGLRGVLPEVGSVNATYCRMVAGTVEHVLQSLLREKTDLLLLETEAISNREVDSLPQIREAIIDVEKRTERAEGSQPLYAPYKAERPSIPGAVYLATSPPSVTPGSTSALIAGGSSRKASICLPSCHMIAADQRGLAKNGESVAVDQERDLSTTAMLSSTPPKNSLLAEVESEKETSRLSYFFQCSDGQFIFLHPLNMKCLKADAEGMRGRLPHAIKGKVLEVERIVLTPENRPRYGFLKHLPLYSEIRFVELDLRREITPETYEVFRADIHKRQNKRKAKEKRERTEKKAADEAKGIGMSDEELRELRRRREAVDLNGPLPSEAAGAAGSDTLGGESLYPNSPPRGSLPDAQVPSSDANRRGSFAEIARMTRVSIPQPREPVQDQGFSVEAFPALGSTSHSPSVTSSPAGQSMATCSPASLTVLTPLATAASTSRDLGSVWGCKASAAATLPQSRMDPGIGLASRPVPLHATAAPPVPPPTEQLEQLPQPPASSLSDILSASTATLATKKRGQGRKGIAVFSTASQRSYA